MNVDKIDISEIQNPTLYKNDSANINSEIIRIQIKYYYLHPKTLSCWYFKHA